MYGYGGDGWGVAYWGLEIYFEKTGEEGWNIKTSRVMVI
jgi:hypothetical protein